MSKSLIQYFSRFSAKELWVSFGFTVKMDLRPRKRQIQSISGFTQAEEGVEDTNRRLVAKELWVSFGFTVQMELRPRKRRIQSFSGFTQAEVEKMENLLSESGEQVCDPEICKKLAKMFTRSKGRAGKPIAKWTEVQAWFRNRLVCYLPKDYSAEANQKLPDITEGCTWNKANESSHIPKGQKDPVLSDLEFEARSSKDGAWYDIDTFVSHRFLNSEEPEALVRFVGFGTGEDEWVNVRKAIRERSVALEDSECNKVKVGDTILCFQEGKNQATYLEAHVIEIEKKRHDIRGCRCLFMIRYTDDDTEETVRLRRICVRPSVLGRPCCN